MHAWPDRAVAALAADQRTLVTRRQLLALGVSRSAIGRALGRDRLHRVHLGVYSLVAPGARPELAAEHAAILLCGDGSVLSHRSAAALWGMCPASDVPVDVIVPRQGPFRGRAGILVHQATHLDRRDVRRHRRLPVTAPARTPLDLARLVDSRALELAFDHALAHHVTSRTAIQEMLTRYPGRPGSPRLRALLHADRPTSVTRSELEERMLALGRRAAFESDRRRDNELRNAGYEVLGVSGRQLDSEPERVVVWVATALARG